MNTHTWQRVENAAIAVAVYVAVIALGYAWWWPLALFLAWDLSALGYVVSTRLGAATYNAIHNYAGPAVLGLVAFVGPGWLMLVALAWAFHVAADRALGYGLKHPDDFQHTHLGWIGDRKRRDS